MSNFGEVSYQFSLIILVISLIGIADMINRWKNGKAYRELRKLKNPNRMTVKILNECESLLRPQWWHWILLCMFTLSLWRIIIDSY
ncbi:MAG TPA: hypothetical protein DEP37_03400 [Algoriphagus sp.]|nr:hypothetical protein [Algoriphagus sp.]